MIDLNVAASALKSYLGSEWSCEFMECRAPDETRMFMVLRLVRPINTRDLLTPGAFLASVLEGNMHPQLVKIREDRAKKKRPIYRPQRRK